MDSISNYKTNKNTIEAIQDFTNQGEIVRCQGCMMNDAIYEELDEEQRALFGDMIQCDNCNTWQHISCMIPDQLVSTDATDNLIQIITDNDKYFCERCHNHPNEKYPHLNLKDEKECNTNTNINEWREKYLHDKVDNILEKKVNISNRRKRNSISNTNRIKKQRRCSTNNSNNTSNDEKLRKNVLNLLTTLFEKFIIPDINELSSIGIRENNPDIPVESAIHELSIKYANDLENELYNIYFDQGTKSINSKLYSEKIRQLYSNLKDKKNLSLKKKLLVSKEVDFKNLIKMAPNELMNSDLQDFKRKVNKKILNDLTIEPSNQLDEAKNEKKAENEIDNYNYDANEAFVNSASFIPKLQTIDKLEKKGKTKIENINLLTSDYELNLKFNANASFIGCSKIVKELNSKKSFNWDVFGDCNLDIEGKLSATKAIDYLKIIKQMDDSNSANGESRIILAYKLQPSIPIPSSSAKKEKHNTKNDDFIKLHSVLSESKKIAGIRNKKRYIKNTYLIPSGVNEKDMPEVIKKLVTCSSTNLPSNNEISFYILMVIKQEYIF